MQFAALFASALALAGSALATSRRSEIPQATIVVEASHGGAGQGLTNTTIIVPVGPVYINRGDLDAVSTLYLTDVQGYPLDRVSCTPYRSTDGSGTHGRPFTSTEPSLLSTNTVQIGSIVCQTI
ncbi:hypothetical protein AAE478_000754 [Parahypoxylon ruwenzoriense]